MLGILCTAQWKKLNPVFKNKMEDPVFELRRLIQCYHSIYINLPVFTYHHRKGMVTGGETGRQLRSS